MLFLWFSPFSYGFHGETSISHRANPLEPAPQGLPRGIPDPPRGPQGLCHLRCLLEGLTCPRPPQTSPKKRAQHLEFLRDRYVCVYIYIIYIYISYTVYIYIYVWYIYIYHIYIYVIYIYDINIYIYMAYGIGMVYSVNIPSASGYIRISYNIDMVLW